MYKLFTTTVAALVLVACGTEDQGMTFEMAETSAEYAYCFDYNGTEFCFDGPVECFPRDNGLDCFATPVDEPEELDRALAGRVGLDDVDVELDRWEATPTEMPMDTERNVAEQITDGLEDLDVPGVDVNEPDRVVDPDFVARVCDVCAADPSSRACDLCAAAADYAEVVDGRHIADKANPAARRHHANIR